MEKDNLINQTRPIFFLYVNLLGNMTPTNKVEEFYFDCYLNDENFRNEERINNSSLEFFINYYKKKIFKYRILDTD